jgi:hypothetical protein
MSARPTESKRHRGRTSSRTSRARLDMRGDFFLAGSDGDFSCTGGAVVKLVPFAFKDLILTQRALYQIPQQSTIGAGARDFKWAQKKFVTWARRRRQMKVNVGNASATKTLRRKGKQPIPFPSLCLSVFVAEL